MITLTLPLAPQPKERPRLGKAGRIYTPKATAEYEHAVRLCAAHLPSLEGALRLDAVFIFDRPKSLKSRGRSPRAARPDLDNLLKALCDGLQGALFADDAQVVEMHAAKVYAAEDEAAHIEVQITQITQVGDTPAAEPTARAETETHARTRAQERQANREAHRAEQARRDAAESPRSRDRADNRAQHLARLLDRPTLTEEDKAARRLAKLLEAEARREQKKIAAQEARRQKSEEEKAAWLEAWRRRTSGSF